MGGIAFVFPGQGAQYSGMGKSLYDHVPAARDIFERAEAIRPGTMRQCFEGPDEELVRTVNTQPCVFATELAAAEAARSFGLAGDAAAGFSMGELAALTYSGAVDFETGFRLICLRGSLMEKAARKVDTGMVAVLKLDADAVKQVCSRYEGVYPVNYNCPGQIAVAGLLSSMKSFMEGVKAAGGRAIPLNVSSAFHSPFMEGAAVEFGKEIRGLDFKAPDIPLYSNYTGGVYAGDFAALLSKQICNPLRWQTIVEGLLASGFDAFVEVGPGKTLSGFVAKTCPEAVTSHIEDMDSLIQAVRESAYVKG